MCVRDEMSFKCDMCSKSFSVKRSLIRHVDSRHRKLKVFCQLCNKPFSRSDSLAHHINTMHPTKDVKKSIEHRRKEKKPVKGTRENARVKKERKRLPPPDESIMTIVNNVSLTPDEKHESIKIPQQTPSSANSLPLPIDDFFTEDTAGVDIKPEVQLEVEPSVEEEQNGDEQYPESQAQIEPYSPGKHKRFTAADELDFTVLDMMQQSALDAKDEDRMFLLSILSDFKRVPVEKKLKVKARIVGAIVDALD